jgi:hypothetical protein
MRFNFDTDDEAAAAGALLVYALYRSRGRRFRVTPDLWGQVERFVKAAAKRARTLPGFLEALKPRLMCESIDPRAMRVGLEGAVTMVRLPSGAFVQPRPDAERREFLTEVLQSVNQAAVLRTLYRETAYVVLLVRERLERERPAESRIAAYLTQADDIVEEETP